MDDNQYPLNTTVRLSLSSTQADVFLDDIKTVILLYNTSCSEDKYCIRPNYCTGCLGFSKTLGKLVVKYPPNKGTLARKFNRGLHEERI